MSSAFLWLAYVHILYGGILYAQTFSPASPGWTQRKLPGNVCRIQIGARAEDVINLEPLVRTDGIPRFVAVFNYENHPWNYSFNPCQDYDIPRDNPHEGYGDRCHSVSICKYTKQYNRLYYYTMGIHADAKFQVALDSANITRVELVYKGIKSMRARNTIIRLVCDKKRVGVEDGLFNITSDTGRGPLYAELHHHCCCPGACWTADLGVNAAPPGSVKSNNTGQAGSSDSEAAAPSSSEGQKKGDSLMFIIIGCLVAVTMVVAFIGGLCYISRTHHQIYSKLPTAMRPGASGQRIRLMAKTNLYDYEPASMARKKILPVLEDTMIHLESLDMCQRLGGGIFGDTHLAKWKEMTVAVKRLTLLVHENQITPEAMKLMKNEVWFLSRQRHKNIVTILGLCLDGKLPSIITEYVIGECLKDFLKVQGRMLTWPHRVRMCAQVADGMAFLHSTKPPIIHRDLRCGNLFLSDNDVVKVADFGLIKLLQPIREECPEDDCCCRRTMSACPASIRWTAPELLAHPVTRETLAPPAVDRSELEGDMGSRKPGARSGGAGADSVITPACDVFSFAMVMWELPMCQDPFEEISTEVEVQEILKNGGRPETPPSADMMPQYKELMKNCWVQEPGNRPTFKQVATRLKDLGSQARSYQRQLENRQRLQKLQQDSLPV